MKIADGNPGKRPLNPHEPTPPDAKPKCPSHLSRTAKNEWKRIAGTLHEMGVLTTVDRAALAAYCQAYGRWVEAEQKLTETPPLIKTPSGYVQQSPWLSIANKQMELMGRYMAELGITPASRSRVAADKGIASSGIVVEIVRFGGTEREPSSSGPARLPPPQSKAH
ncbi:MAG: phage terminase small subunit P27 family [Pseudomonadota bacterium]